MLNRLAKGDYRPTIMSGGPGLFREAVNNLRITAETLARQRKVLAEEEMSTSVILGSMTEGVIVTGSDLKIRLVNKAAAAMFNLQGSSTGLLLQEACISHDLQELAQRTFGTREIQRCELNLNIAGRSDPCSLMVTAVCLKSTEMELPEGVLLVMHDVSRLRELEAVRREFVANVSHEFRTPLSVINGYLETLELGGVGKEMMKKSITVMRRHADRMNNLIEDLLTISRMEEKEVRLEKTPVNLAPLLANVIEQIEKEIHDRRVTVRIEIPDALPHVRVDAYRIEQAFSNLLANALRHGTPAGDGKESRVEIHAIASGAELCVSFRDNGPGIPFQDQRHLFERFYRVGGDRDRQTGGTGLGLSIVKNVVEAHKGRVTLESKPGAGSTFSVFLPLTD